MIVNQLQLMYIVQWYSNQVSMSVEAVHQIHGLFFLFFIVRLDAFLEKVCPFFQQVLGFWLLFAFLGPIL